MLVVFPFLRGLFLNEQAGVVFMKIGCLKKASLFNHVKIVYWKKGGNLVSSNLTMTPIN